MTRSISTWPSADVDAATPQTRMPPASDGATIFQALPSFFSVVASPAADGHLHFVDLVGLHRGEDLLLLGLPAAAPPSGSFEVTK